MPSPDTQPELTVRGDAQTSVRVSSERKATSGPVATNQSRDPGVTILGVALGLPQIWKLRSEIGVDYVTAGSETEERSPATLHAKIVIPELALFENSPAFAVGISNYGPKTGKTDQNMTYGLLAATFPSIGRISAGGFISAEHAVGPGGVESGVLISLDRLLTERLWLGVDYIGGENINSGVSAGVSYAFSKRVALMAGYNLHTARQYSGVDTVTIRASFTFF